MDIHLQEKVAVFLFHDEEDIARAGDGGADDGAVLDLVFSGVQLTPSGRGKIKKALSFDRASKNMAATYSPALWCSTIGHEGLNFSVRYGKR